MANFFMGTPSRFEKIKRFDPGQAGGIEQMLSQGLGGLKEGPPSFEPIRERAMRTLRQDIQPGIAQRFTMMGAQRSGGFQEAMERSGEDLTSTLAAMESQFGQQRFSNLMQMLGVGLEPTEETGYFGGDQGLFKGLIPGISKGIGGMMKAIPGAVGSYYGAKAGGTLGGAAGGPPGAVAGTAGGMALQKLLSYLISAIQSRGQGGDSGGSVSMETPRYKI